MIFVALKIMNTSNIKFDVYNNKIYVTNLIFIFFAHSFEYSMRFDKKETKITIQYNRCMC